MVQNGVKNVVTKAKTYLKKCQEYTSGTDYSTTELDEQRDYILQLLKDENLNFLDMRGGPFS